MVSPLRKLVWMVVAIAAMLLLAPMAASAHEGHHGGAAVQSSLKRSQAVGHALGAVETQAAGFASAWSPAPSDAPCAAGCCAGMVCCVVAIVTAPPTLVPPAWILAQPAARAPPLFSGLFPSSLLEPPNPLT